MPGTFGPDAVPPERGVRRRRRPGIIASAMVLHSVRGHPALDRPVPAPGAPFLASPLREDRPVLGRPVPDPFRDRQGCGDGFRGGAPRLRAGVHPVHHSALGALYGVRWCAPEGAPAGNPCGQHGNPRPGDLAGVVDGNHRRGHAPDSPADPGERVAQEQGPPDRVLHLPGGEHRGIVDTAGRPAAVPRVPEGRRLLLDVRAPDGEGRRRRRDSHRRVLPHRLRAREARGGIAAGGGGRGSPGLEGSINFLFLGGIVAAILYSGSASKEEMYWDQAEFEKAAPEMQLKQGEIDAIQARIEAAPEAERKPIVDELLTKRGELNAVRGTAEHHATKGIHFTSHVTMPYVNLVRDGILILMGILSLMLTAKETRRQNGFTWFPIVEVAKLFAGIFITIIPAIAILKAGPNGALKSVVEAVTTSTGAPVDVMYFWLTGILSAFLDNAPTYLVFFNTAGGNADYLMNTGASTLIAISAGAVFFGAVTYIGNAPNFMVRSIAEEAGIKMPSFFGYLLKWSLVFLIPTFALITWLFIV